MLKTLKKQIEELRDKQKQQEYENSQDIWISLIKIADSIDKLWFYKKDE